MLMNATDTNALFTPAILALVRKTVAKAAPLHLRDDAESQVLSHLIKVVREGKYSPERGAFEAFVNTVTVFECKRIRKYEKRREHDVETMTEKGPVAVIDTLKGSDGRIDAARSQEHKLLAKALDTLSPEDREFIRLITEEDMAQGEAGATFGWNAVKASRKRREIEAALRAAITGEDGEDE